MDSPDPRTLLGLPLVAARQLLAEAGWPQPRVLRAEPPRARHVFPDEPVWRVVRVRFLPDVPELVIAPPIALCIGDDASA